MLHQATKSDGSGAMEYPSEELDRVATDTLYARLGKRCLDLALVLAVAPVAAPLIAIFALLARRDGGPAFYGHARVGRGGRLFTCWKIRTMVQDSEARLKAHLEADPAARAEWERDQKLRDDPRITAFGRFLRATSLDELPQIWNIASGDMSLVGPRPFTPEQTHLYHGRSYFALRPGLTGPWQVGDRNDASFASRAIHDARYARELSLGRDLSILVRTVRVVLARTGR